ncbi:MAG: Ig-like domain-containing protein [Bacteroidales bacterium]|nr:Ig-like domain-containing protein [Bacteroidales bacterium]
MKYFSFIFLFFITELLLGSCANMASPSGGPYDEEPPKYISSIPLMNQTGFKKKKIEILFDENILIEGASEKVVVSPPQKKLPVIKAIGKKVIVELQDTLLENTTYTIDFNDAIADNNEKNVLEGFSFAFSTGDTIDSLCISGTLLNASDLEPMKSITIGLHQNMDDSAFFKLPFVRTSKTNEKGQFTIRNIPTGTYRIFALNDINGDYRFDQKGEDIAFLDSVITPTFTFAVRNDTIWKDSVTVDHIHEVQYTDFKPDDLILLLFKENFSNQYLIKRERKEPNILSVFFNEPVIQRPEYRLLEEKQQEDLFYPQFVDDGKTLNLWIKDSVVFAKDTLLLEMTYSKSDSLGQLVSQTDTLLFAAKKVNKSTKSNKRKKDEIDTTQLQTFKIKAEIPPSMDIYVQPVFEFSEPVEHLDSSMIRVEVKKDSLWIPYSYKVEQDSINSLVYRVLSKWDYDKEYRILSDSASIFSIYDKANIPVNANFKIKPQNSYSHLYFNLPELKSSAFVELLDGSDKVVRTAKVRNKGALFKNVLPGKYYARLILDLNGNGQWDPGDYQKRLQSEPVFYYPNAIELIQNWEIEQNWNPFELSIDRQKPFDVIQNKPKEKKNKKEGR